MTKPNTRDRHLADFARHHHYVVDSEQLAALGFGRAAIRHRLGDGRLHRVHRGVYAVGRSDLSVRGRWLAAVLAVGAGAVLSHRCAGALHGLVPFGGGAVDVTVAGARGSRQGIRVHRVRSLAPEDRVCVAGIPATSAARTLLDLAEALPPGSLDRALEQAERLRVFDLRGIEAVMARAYGRRGLAPLRSALARFRGDPGTRSELERRFLDLCIDAGLPRPVVNAVVAGIEVDCSWPGLVVELDGYAHHGGRAAFERDRERDVVLQAAGYRVLRFTARRVDRDPGGVVAAVAALMR